MNERKIVYKVLKAIENIFPDTIAYAYLDSWWNICVSNYSVYCSKDFKTFASEVHRVYNISIVFVYCHPIEKVLLELAEQDNLILNIKE